MKPKVQPDKFCPSCNKTLSIKDFYYFESTGHYGTECKECDKDRKRKWYADNKKYADKRRKEWQNKNYELHLEHQTKYNNSEKGVLARKRYKERLKASQENSPTHNL